MQNNTMQYNTIHYNTIQCNAVQYNTKHVHILNPLLHAIRNNGIRFFSFWNSKENVSNKVIPKKKF